MAQRLGFSKLVDRMEAGDVLIVTKLDRLGRFDLTSSAGTMTMNVLNAVAQFERDLLIERTQAGLMRAKEAGKKLGRPSSLSDADKQGVLNALAAGESVSVVAKRWGTSRQTVMRVRSAAGTQPIDALLK